ncbi:MAG: hypothetical protein ACE5KE_00280 [Methanosarcinales archaeon]
MVKIAEWRFLFGYLIFVFFLVFIISLGAGDYFAGNIAEVCVNASSVGNITGTSPQCSIVVPSPPTAFDPISTLIYVVASIFFFFQLMTVDAGILWLGIIIFSPALIMLLYILLRLIRGGG